MLLGTALLGAVAQWRGPVAALVVAGFGCLAAALLLWRDDEVRRLRL